MCVCFFFWSLFLLVFLNKVNSEKGENVQMDWRRRVRGGWIHPLSNQTAQENKNQPVMRQQAEQEKRDWTCVCVYEWGRSLHNTCSFVEIEDNWQRLQRETSWRVVVSRRVVWMMFAEWEGNASPLSCAWVSEWVSEWRERGREESTVCGLNSFLRFSLFTVSVSREARRWAEVESVSERVNVCHKNGLWCPTAAVSLLSTSTSRMTTVKCAVKLKSCC